MSKKTLKTRIMQAKETKLQELIEGTKQYIVPLFQREYTWNSKEWKILWDDINELCKDENPKNGKAIRQLEQ